MPTSDPRHARFVHRTRYLREWMLDLVHPDADRRREAGDVLWEMYVGLLMRGGDDAVAAAAVGFDPEAHQAEWRAEVRGVVEKDGFAVQEYFGAVASLVAKDHKAWMEHCDRLAAVRAKADAQFDRLLDKAKARADADPSEENKSRLADRLVRAVGATAARECREDKASAPKDDGGNAGMMRGMVIGDAGPRLLEAPEAIRMVLDSGREDVAVHALEKIGPAAVGWAEWFLSKLDGADEHFVFRFPRELAAIGRGSATVAGELVARLSSAKRETRHSAAATLMYMTPDLGGADGAAFAALNRMIASDAGDDMGVFRAWVSVGRTRPGVAERVAKEIAAQPARMKTVTYEGGHTYEYDEAMSARGPAIEAAAYLTHAPEVVVPALVEAFDTFEEYDPDWTYGGIKKRVCTSLKAFGAAAAPVTPRAAAFLEEWMKGPRDSDFPNDVIEMLGAIGPGAAGALAVLERLRAEQWDPGDGPQPEKLNPEDGVDRAILRIRGR